MTQLSLAEKIRRADERGIPLGRIAEMYRVTPKEVYRVLWERDNKEHRRQWDAARKKKIYHADEEYRRKKIKESAKRRKGRPYNTNLLSIRD